MNNTTIMKATLAGATVILIASTSALAQNNTTCSTAVANVASQCVPAAVSVAACAKTPTPLTCAAASVAVNQCARATKDAYKACIDRKSTRLNSSHLGI